MLVEREVQDAHCRCPSHSLAMPEVRALLGQSRIRPSAQCLPCPTGLSSALPSALSDVCQRCTVLHSNDALLLLSVWAGPGEVVEGLPEFEGCFLRVITNSCNVNF